MTTGCNVERPSKLHEISGETKSTSANMPENKNHEIIMKTNAGSSKNEERDQNKGNFFLRSFRKPKQNLPTKQDRGNNNNNNNNKNSKMIFDENISDKRHASTLSLNKGSKKIKKSKKSKSESNNENFQDIKPKTKPDTSEKGVRNTEKRSVGIERLSSGKQLAQRNVHDDYAARMSRKRPNLLKNTAEDIQIVAAETVISSRPLRHRRPELRDLIKLNNKTKLAAFAAKKNSQSTAELNPNYDNNTSRYEKSLTKVSHPYSRSYGNILDTTSEELGKYSRINARLRNECLEDITNTRKKPQRKYLSSEYSIPQATLMDQNFNSRLSVNSDYPSKRASWSAVGSDYFHFSNVLSLPARETNLIGDNTVSNTSLSPGYSIANFYNSQKKTNDIDPGTTSFIQWNMQASERKTSNRKDKTHGIQCSSTENSSGNCSPDNNENKPRNNKKVNQKDRYRPASIKINGPMTHSRSVSISLGEKPFKPQTPKPTKTAGSATSLKDLRFNFSLQNLCEEPLKESPRKNKSSSVSRSLKDLRTSVGFSTLSKNNSVATVPVYDDTMENFGAFQSDKVQQRAIIRSPDARTRRKRSRPLSLRLTAAIPEHVVIDQASINQTTNDATAISPQQITPPKSPDTNSPNHGDIGPTKTPEIPISILRKSQTWSNDHEYSACRSVQNYPRIRHSIAIVEPLEEDINEAVFDDNKKTPKPKTARPFSVIGDRLMTHQYYNSDVIMQQSELYSVSIPVGLDQIQVIPPGQSYSESMTPEINYPTYPSGHKLEINEDDTFLTVESMPLAFLSGQNALYVEALWDHVTMDSDELAFNAGDVVCVTDMTDPDWWWGCLDDRQGWFPASFVRALVNQNLLRNSDSSSSSSQDEDLHILSQGRQSEDEAVVLQEISPNYNHREHPESNTNSSLCKSCDKYTPLNKKNIMTSVEHKMTSILPTKDEVKRHKMRANVIREILNSEKDFVSNLKNVIEGYLVRCQKRHDMFDGKTISTIFSNIEDICKFQQEFLSTLESAYCKDRPHESDVGAAFLRHKSGFETYSQYCNNHPKAMGTLVDLLASKRYSNFFETCRLLQGMISISLDGFLLTPVQKICKYPLQVVSIELWISDKEKLAELLKYTREHDPDYNNVKNALEAMTSVARMINERKRQTESIEKIAAWQRSIVNWKGDDILTKSCELIYSDVLYVIMQPKSKPQLRMAYLFDHQLVLCKKDLLRKDMHYYKTRINLDDCVIESVDTSKDSDWMTSSSISLDLLSVCNLWIIENKNQDIKILMFTKNESDAAKWQAAFQKERQLSTDQQRSCKLISREIKEAIIRRSSVMQLKHKAEPDVKRSLQYRQRVKLMQRNRAQNVLNNNPRTNNFLSNIAVKFATLRRPSNRQIETKALS